MRDMKSAEIPPFSVKVEFTKSQTSRRAINFHVEVCRSPMEEQSRRLIYFSGIRQRFIAMQDIFSVNKVPGVKRKRNALLMVCLPFSGFLLKCWNVMGYMV